eukprot:TRINITY_DN4583_c0_g1_i11.p2 TRINITY_DN4583_c0_g1~~TRINITY_DN4583_c0_g1_i11.p2  ORF type:complete len:370 (+),score=70.40 TRINITY_DN4583_c0_g1_i11:146-1255(+)
MYSGYPAYQGYYQQYMYPQISYGYYPQFYGYSGYPAKQGGYQRGGGSGYGYKGAPAPRAENSLKMNGTVGKYEFKISFPRAKDYSSLENLRESFPSLKRLEVPPSDGVLTNAQYFILTSNTEQDLHKAIKYGVWTSTPRTNKVLSSEFQEAKKNIQNVFIFFSMKDTNKIMGVAEMKGDVDYYESFTYWAEPLKWFGQFELEWLYVKDLSLEEVGDLITRRDTKDGRKLDPEVGMKIVKRFMDKPFTVKDTLFNYFEYLDVLEDEIRRERDTDINFIMRFDELKKTAPHQSVSTTSYQRGSQGGAGRRGHGGSYNSAGGFGGQAGPNGTQGPSEYQLIKTPYATLPEGGKVFGGPIDTRSGRPLEESKQ